MALSGGAWAQIHSKPPFPYRLPLRRIGPKQDAVHLEGAVPVTAGVVYHEGFGVEDLDFLDSIKKAGAVRGGTGVGVAAIRGSRRWWHCGSTAPEVRS